MNYAELIGIPFAYGGRDEKAFDCYGLLMYLFRHDSGIELPDYKSVKDQKRIMAMISMGIMDWKKVEPKAPSAGLAIAFKIAGLISHVGYTIGNGKFIHTWESSGGVVIESLSDWNHRIVGFYEFDA